MGGWISTIGPVFDPPPLVSAVAGRRAAGGSRASRYRLASLRHGAFPMLDENEGAANPARVAVALGVTSLTVAPHASTQRRHSDNGRCSLIVRGGEGSGATLCEPAADPGQIAASASLSA